MAGKKSAKKDTTLTEITNASGKDQALNLAVDQIKKQFGAGAIMQLGADHKIDVETFSS